MLLLTIAISSCTTHSTAPVAAPPHPFPQTFSEVTVTYRNIPEYWESASDSWYWDANGDSTVDHSSSGSGNSSYSGVITLMFSDSAFSQSGDTIKAPGLSLVVDDVAGVLDQFQYSYSGGGGMGGWSYSMDCRQIPYERDSTNQIVGMLTAQSLQSGLVTFDTSSEFDFNQERQGQSSSSSQTYKDSVGDNASLTVRFIPLIFIS